MTLSEDLHLPASHEEFTAQFSGLLATGYSLPSTYPVPDRHAFVLAIQVLLANGVPYNDIAQFSSETRERIAQLNSSDLAGLFMRIKQLSDTVQAITGGNTESLPVSNDFRTAIISVITCQINTRASV